MRQAISSRYAIFVKPQTGCSLWSFGSRVVGYDAETGDSIARPDGLSPEPDWAEFAADPQRYGFHGTLKAPFHLAQDRSEEDLIATVRAFAQARSSFDIPSLRVATLGSFLALVPAAPVRRLDRLADDCVRELDPFRAPSTEADRERRLAAPLTARQIEALDLWGYPYVFADFRFHMTLTGRLPEHLREPIRVALSAQYDAIAETPALAVDAVAIFRQPSRTERFRVLAQCPFGR